MEFSNFLKVFQIKKRNLIKILRILNKVFEFQNSNKNKFNELQFVFLNFK